MQTCVRLWRKQEEIFSKGQPTLESAHLSILGLDPERYYPLKSESNKREYIRKVISQSAPSFGRFMTEVYQHRDEVKTKLNSESSKHLLTHIRGIGKKEKLSKEDVLDLCVYAYEYSRAAKL
jgi:hypothetical protein